MTTALIQRILAPVDLSSCSRASLEFACQLGSKFDAKIEVLLVRHSGQAGPDELPATLAELHRFVSSIPGASAGSITERIEAGNAQERIVSIANTGGFDAVVLGTHGRTGRAHSLAGSVAESVVRNATCPVITVRERR
jgi:nucleotide-binding universal stress UspA family protein